MKSVAVNSFELALFHLLNTTQLISKCVFVFELFFFMIFFNVFMYLFIIIIIFIHSVFHGVCALTSFGPCTPGTVDRVINRLKAAFVVWVCICSSFKLRFHAFHLLFYVRSVLFKLLASRVYYLNFDCTFTALPMFSIKQRLHDYRDQFLTALEFVLTAIDYKG